MATLTWDFSRNQRRHTAYADDGQGDRFWITSAAPYRAFQGKHGYNLTLPESEEVIQHSDKVCVLKEAAEKLANQK